MILCICDKALGSTYISHTRPSLNSPAILLVKNMKPANQLFGLIIERLHDLDFELWFSSDPLFSFVIYYLVPHIVMHREQNL